MFFCNNTRVMLRIFISACAKDIGFIDLNQLVLDHEYQAEVFAKTDACNNVDIKRLANRLKVRLNFQSPGRLERELMIAKIFSHTQENRNNA